MATLAELVEVDDLKINQNCWLQTGIGATFRIPTPRLESPARLIVYTIFVLCL